MPIYEFQVEMTCTGCSGAVERVLGRLGDKIQRVTIDLEGKRVKITSNLPANELLQVLEKTGKKSIYLGEID